MTRVRRSILICFVARSGSWYLCGLLASTGALGRPEELFWAPDDGVRDARPEDVLPSGTTANGVFACKFQLGQWQEVLARERRAAPGVADRELVERCFPHPLYVWLRREDAVAQAVSWSRALQTGRWSASDPGQGEATYDRAQIEGLVELIREETEDWRRWFAEQGVEPHRVTYEEVLADPQAAVAGIAAAAGVELPPDTELEPYPGRERQADALNEEWIARFREGAPA